MGPGLESLEWHGQLPRHSEREEELLKNFEDWSDHIASALHKVHFEKDGFGDSEEN